MANDSRAITATVSSFVFTRKIKCYIMRGLKNKITKKKLLIDILMVMLLITALAIFAVVL